MHRMIQSVSTDRKATCIGARHRRFDRQAGALASRTRLARYALVSTGTTVSSICLIIYAAVSETSGVAVGQSQVPAEQLIPVGSGSTSAAIIGLTPVYASAVANGQTGRTLACSCVTSSPVIIVQVPQLAVSRLNQRRHFRRRQAYSQGSHKYQQSSLCP